MFIFKRFDLASYRDNLVYCISELSFVVKREQLVVVQMRLQREVAARWGDEARFHEAR
jgi:hypothetical protein